MGHGTKEFFPAFKEEVEEWVKRFGLIGWQLEILCLTRDELEDVEDSKAICRTMQTSRCAQIVLNAEWPEWEIPSEYYVRKSAFHEVCELLLVRTEYLAFDRTTTKEQYEEERHIVIRTLENAVFAREFADRRGNVTS